MSMEVLPNPENEKYQSRHELDKLSLDKESERDKEEDRMRFGITKSPIQLSINDEDDNVDEDDEVDAINDDQFEEQLQIEHSQGKEKRQLEADKKELYIDQVDTTNQLFDGDEAMEMD